MNKNETGFGIAEVLLVVLLVVFMGGATAYWISQNSDDDDVPQASSDTERKTTGAGANGSGEAAQSSETEFIEAGGFRIPKVLPGLKVVNIENDADNREVELRDGGLRVYVIARTFTGGGGPVDESWGVKVHTSQDSVQFPEITKREKYDLGLGCGDQQCPIGDGMFTGQAVEELSGKETAFYWVHIEDSGREAEPRFELYENLVTGTTFPRLH